MSLHQNEHDVNCYSTEAEMGHNGGPPLDDAGFPNREGFVAIARALRDHWLVGFGQPVNPADPERGGSFSKAEAWIDLIMECRYREGTVNNNGKKMTLRKGQLVGAVSWLANRWNWTPKTVRGFLDKLEKEGMITQTKESPSFSSTGSEMGRSKGKYANVLSVCKYELFQLAYRDAGQVPGMVQGRYRAGTGQVQGDIYKEGTKEQRNKGTKEPNNQQPPLSETPRDVVVVDGAEDVVRFVMKYANVTESEARSMLRNNCRHYGTENVFDAYSQTVAKMACDGKVATPYKYMISAAGKIRDERKLAAENQQRRSERGDRQIAAKSEMLAIAQGYRDA